MRCRAQFWFHHEAVMAVDDGRCCAFLARSLPGWSVPVGLVKVICFLCVVNQWPSGPIDPWMGGGLQAWVVHSPSAPTATAAINAFLCEVCWRVLVNTDYSSVLRPWALSDSILVKSHCSTSVQAQKKKKNPTLDAHPRHLPHLTPTPPHYYRG